MIRNSLNGREYVGITVSPLWLWLNGHNAAARKGVNGKLYNAIRRYGAKSFAIELVRNDAQNFAELQQQEIEEIRKRDTLRRGYNTSPGGGIGTPEQRTIAGQRYSSRNAAAFHFGIDPTVFNLRIGRLRWTPEQAAEIEPRDKYARRKVTVDGTDFPSLKAAAEHFGVDYQLAHERLTSKGWTLEQALGAVTPPETIKFRGVRIAAFGQSFPSLNECARHFGIKPESLRRRIRHCGESADVAIAHLRKRSRRKR